MPGRGKYIDGIYNYCDSWCERCPFTARCRNFAMQQSMKRRIQRKDEENAKFWEALEKALGESIDPSIKQAADLPADTTDEDPLQSSDSEAFIGPLLRERPEQNHLLAKRSRQYIRAVDRFFSSYRIPPRHGSPLDEAFSVIRWYQLFINVKLGRALHGRSESQENGNVDDDQFVTTSDSDGSAKIAIIAIERSISAWSIVRRKLPKKEAQIVRLMALLVRTRALADQVFPRAREFHRPGFDDLEEGI